MSLPLSAPFSLHHAFAVAAPGLEPITAAELRALRLTRPHIVEGGVEFTASRDQLYTANLHLRTASRVIVRLASFHASSFAELERRGRTVPWASILAPRQPVRLRVTCNKSRLYHSDAVAERIHESISTATGGFAASTAADTDDGTDSQLFIVRIDHDECTISADTSGANLHQRGYRRAITQAPLRETLAAAMLLATSWETSSTLVDPFCGSGTIPIEAAMMAMQMAPGRNRSFRFMTWPDFEPRAWGDVLARAQEMERPMSTTIVGSDRSAWAIRAARANAERAGVANSVRFERSDATELPSRPGSPGWLVTNPPYGVRLASKDELRDVYARFGSALRAGFSRWHLGILSTERRLDAQLRIPLLERLRTTNGGIRVHLLVGRVP